MTERAPRKPQHQALRGCKVAPPPLQNPRNLTRTLILTLTRTLTRSVCLETDRCRGLGTAIPEYGRSSQVYTKTTDNHTEAYRMCSGSQQGRTGVDGDGGGGSILDPSRGDTS